MLADLDSRGTGNLESRTVTICSGLDLVNISYNHFVAADERTAKVLVVTRVCRRVFVLKMICNDFLVGQKISEEKKENSNQYSLRK